MLEVYSILEGRAAELRAVKSPCDHAAPSSDNPHFWYDDDITTSYG